MKYSFETHYKSAIILHFSHQRRDAYYFQLFEIAQSKVLIQNTYFSYKTMVERLTPQIEINEFELHFAWVFGFIVCSRYNEK